MGGACISSDSLRVLSCRDVGPIISDIWMTLTRDASPRYMEAKDAAADTDAAAADAAAAAAGESNAHCWFSKYWHHSPSR